MGVVGEVEWRAASAFYPFRGASTSARRSRRSSMPDRRILLAMLVAAFTSFEGSLLITTFLQLQSADDTLKALVQHLLMQQSLALMMILPGLASVPLRLRDLQAANAPHILEHQAAQPFIGLLCEKQVKGDWATTLPHYERSRYIPAFRMDKPTFRWLYQHYGRMLGKPNTMMREAVCGKKRLCIFLG